MRVSLKELRFILRDAILLEEKLNGLPEWQLRQDASEFVDRIRDRIKRYILTNRSRTSLEQKEAIAAMNAVCDDLEERVFEVLDDRLAAFNRSI